MRAAIRARTGAAIIFVALATGLVLASTAWACTGYAGRFIVETPTGTVTSEGDGSSTGTHGRCEPVDRDAGTAWPADSQGVVVKVENGKCSTLHDGEFTISYITSKVMDATNVEGFALARYDCMNPPGADATRNSSQGWIPLGTITVQNGVGQTSEFLEPLPETTPGEGLVCISDAAGLWGNEVPLKFL